MKGKIFVTVYYPKSKCWLVNRKNHVKYLKKRRNDKLLPYQQAANMLHLDVNQVKPNNFLTFQRGPDEVLVYLTLKRENNMPCKAPVFNQFDLPIEDNKWWIMAGIGIVGALAGGGLLWKYKDKKTEQKEEETQDKQKKTEQKEEEKPDKEKKTEKKEEEKTSPLQHSQNLFTPWQYKIVDLNHPFSKTYLLKYLINFQHAITQIPFKDDSDDSDRLYCCRIVMFRDWLSCKKDYEKFSNRLFQKYDKVEHKLLGSVGQQPNIKESLKKYSASVATEYIKKYESYLQSLSDQFNKCETQMDLITRICNTELENKNIPLQPTPIFGIAELDNCFQNTEWSKQIETLNDKSRTQRNANVVYQIRVPFQYMPDNPGFEEFIYQQIFSICCAKKK